MNAVKSSKPVPASRSLNPKLRRIARYSSIDWRRVFIGHLLAKAEQAYAVPSDQSWCRCGLCRGVDVPTPHRSRRVKHLDATSGWPVHGETDVLHRWER